VRFIAAILHRPAARSLRGPTLGFRGVVALARPYSSWTSEVTSLTDALASPNSIWVLGS
jgi:hypothetical protein